MRYFIISDVHGEYDKMIAALQAAGFNKETDCLVSNGDFCDRGPKSLEVLRFFFSCPHRFLLWGNHDAALYRHLYRGVPFDISDVSNGEVQTFFSFLKQGEANRQKSFSSSDLCIYKLRYFSDSDAEEARRLFYRYCGEAIFSLEFPDCIITHGWVPNYRVQLKMSGDVYHNCDEKGRPQSWEDYWRSHSTVEDWYEYGLWADTSRVIRNNFFPNKQMIVGHFWACLIAGDFTDQDYFLNREITRPFACSPIFKNDKVVAIDGCSNIESGHVNVYIIDEQATPEVTELFPL